MSTRIPGSDPSALRPTSHQPTHATQAAQAASNVPRIADTALSNPPAIQQHVAAPVAALFPDAKTVAHKGPVAGALKLHETRMSPRYTSFEAAFVKVLGKQALQDLRAGMTDKPIVLIAGDQCTGKGTAASGLVAALGGSNTGTGTVLRSLAKENGLTIEQMSALLTGKSAQIDDKGTTRTVTLADYPHLGTAEDVDVKLDFRAARAIATGELTKADGEKLELSVFESRLAGHLGSFLEGLGRKNVISVYLAASPKEQALRYVNREVSPAARARVEPELAKLPATASLGDCLKALVASGDPEVGKLADKISGIAGRDDNDKTRLLGLYGVNYQERSAFDVVVDTSGKTPAEVQAAILQAVKQKTAAA